MEKFREFEKIEPFSGREKFIVGEKSDDFKDIKTLKPTFAFDYISLKGGTFCFNSEKLGRSSYIDLIKGLKEVSAYTYEELNASHKYHFHDMQFDDISIRKSDFYKRILGSYSDEDYITPYQFKTVNKSRVVGFLYKGVFYIVMCDSDHEAYKQEDNKKKRKKRR